MNTNIERLEDNKVKFEITIDAQTVDKEIDDIYRQVNRTARIPGFRKGKAPRAVLDRNFGAEYFASQATANLVERFSPAAVDEADMVPLRNYEYDPDAPLVEQGRDYTYTFTIVIKPQMELSSIDPVEIELQSPAATDEEIDAQIEMLRGYYIDLEPVTDRPVAAEDIITYSQTCEVNGEPIEEGREESSTHVLGSELSTALDEQLVGMEIGKEKEITLPSSEFGLEDKYPDTEITAKVTVEEITEKKPPELTDEWVKKTLDAENVEALRQQVGESITREKESRLDRDKSLECLEALSKRLQGDVPEEVVQDCQSTALRNLYINLQNQGITVDQYLRIMNITAEKFYDDMAEQGTALAKQEMALDALARGLELEVTEEDITKAFEDSDLSDPAKARKEWEEDHKMALLREEILRDKAARWLYDNAVVNFTEAGADDAAETAEVEDADVASEDATEASEEGSVE